MERRSIKVIAVLSAALLPLGLFAYKPVLAHTKSLWMKNGPQGIMMLHVKLGEYVKKGQPVYSLNTDMEKVDLGYYKKEVEFYKEVIKHIQIIRDQNIISKNFYDSVLQDMQVAQANVEKTKAIIKNRTYLSPFDGTVTQIYCYDGSGVSDNTPMVEITKGHVEVDTAHPKATVCNRDQGVIDQMMVHEGEHVEKGQLLFTMRMNEFEAQLNADLAKCDYLSKVFKRDQILRDRGVSIIDYLDAGIEALKSIAQVEKDRIQINQQNKYAPFTGTVTQIYAYSGQGTAHDKPIIDIVADA